MPLFLLKRKFFIAIQEQQTNRNVLSSFVKRYILQALCHIFLTHCTDVLIRVLYATYLSIHTFKVGWIEIALFVIFENGQITADYVYFYKIIFKKLSILAARTWRRCSKLKSNTGCISCKCKHFPLLEKKSNFPRQNMRCRGNLILNEIFRIVSRVPLNI